MRYLRIYFDRMLPNRKHVQTTALKYKKGLLVLKAMDAKGIENATSSYCIKMWCSASLSTDKASQQWHRQIC